MRRLASHPARIAVLLMALSVILTGCFQPVGAPLLPTQQSNVQNPPPLVTTLAATDVAILPTTEPPPATQELFPPTAQLPSPVPTTRVAPTRAPELPSLTPFPTITPTETPFPTLALFTETPTETPFVFPTFDPTATETPFELALPPTNTPEPTWTPFPTETPLPTNTPEPTVTPFPTETSIPQFTATPTLFIPTVDALPTQVALQVTSELQLTLDAQATQIIAVVTATAAFNATSTSVALGTPLAPPDGGFGVTPIAPPPTVVPGFPPNWLIPTDGAQGNIDEACIYTVIQGDRLIRIALRFNTGIRALARLNGIVNVDLISVGQRLRIPCNVAQPDQPLLPPGVTPTPLPIVNGYRVYVVQQGDNLFRLSLRYNVPIRTIAALNGIYNINLIYVGQRILIP